MDELFYDAIDFLKCLISTPSTSRDESRAADVVERFVKAAGFAPMRHGCNVWCSATTFNPSLPTIWLNSHIDTVKPAAGWTLDPFTPTEADDRLYGLGTNDAGASVVSLFAAFRHLAETGQPYNLIFLASCEEEVSGRGGIESMIQMLPKADLVVVGEPTGMQPAVAEKGLMVLDGEIAGVAGHAARNEGVNAIYRAIEVIDTLRNFNFDRISPMLGPIKVSVTQIESGTAHNVVPDRCRIVVDVRTTEEYSNQQTLDILRQAVPQCTLTPRSTRLNPSGISSDHPFVARAAMLGLEPFGSPTLSDQALIAYTSVKIGPGQSSRSHTADEYIEPDEIRRAIATYIALLDNLRL